MFLANRRRVLATLLVTLLTAPVFARADNSLRGGAMASRGKSSSPANTSQTATSATDNTSQTIATNSASQQAQASLTHSLQSLQALQAAQLAARTAAVNGANNLGVTAPGGPNLPNVTDGLSLGGLVPTGGLTATLSGSSIQLLQLGANGKGTLTLGSAGKVVLPNGTPGNDTLSVSGAGSITATAGTISATAGSLTTKTGGTLSTTNGGTIALTGGGSTLTVVAATSITSSLSGVITLPGSGTKVSFTAGQETPPIPAGSKITFSGTAAGTVTITGAGIVTLGGAGTLTLAASTGMASGGSITTNSGAASFTNGVSTSLPAGSTIVLNGAGSVNFSGGTAGAVPVILPAATTNYTTSGTLLATTGYALPSSWVLGPSTNPGALSQSVDATSGHVTDTITQEQQQALLYWSSFNIGKNTTLSFDQSAGGANVNEWVAINQITDPSLHPSQILGAIQAPGQVYVINQNGIIFGGSSQVNVGALTASSLALNPNYISNGLLNDAGNDFQFEFSSLFTTTTAKTGTRGHQVVTTTVAPLFTAPPAQPAGGTLTVSSVATGDVTVQAGAQLSASTNEEHQGGRIALIGPNVNNAGTISTPDGQTILAAGLQVGLAAHNANDPSLRGLDTFVGQVQAGATTVPTGTFTFNGLPNNQPLTFGGSGQVGSYTAPGASTATAIMGGTPVTIPPGSTVVVTSGAPPSFAAIAAGQAGTVTNAANSVSSTGQIMAPGGNIEAPRADVILTGQTVNQLGIINSSTSVTLNGRIDLLADYGSSAENVSGVMEFQPFETGSVNLGGQSVTQIVPETSSSETTIGTQLALSSLVDIQGQAIDFQSGSLLFAPGARTPTAGKAFDLSGAVLTSGVTVDAGSWYSLGNLAGQIQTLFSNDSGQIGLDAGATIDVSGSQNVSASVAEDIIPVQLRGPELANSPLQRGGSLRGTTVYVDIRDVGVFDGKAYIGTPLGDISGYVNDIGRTAGELTTNGGSVSLSAGASVVMGKGAAINVSGGSIDYAGATVQTTQVRQNGQSIDISQANPDIAYSGIYNGFTATSQKWGVSQTFLNSLLSGSQYDAGFVQGGSGGAIAITAPSMALSGNFYGNTVTGAQQRTPLPTLDSTYAGASFLPTTLAISGTPEASQLSLSFYQQTVDRMPDIYPSTSPNVEFQTDAYIAQNAPAANQILLSQDIVNTNGFGTLNIDTSGGGNISVPQGVSLTAMPGAEISFTAANIDVEGSMAAPGGGGIRFKVLDVSPSILATPLSTPADDPTRGNFVLGADASLSATGLLVDDRATAATPDTLPFATNGGSISIAGLNVQLATGSTIDVSGGAALGAGGTPTFGNAGSISILGGVDPAFSSLVTGGRLVLGSTLTGYSGKIGGAGSLTIQAPLVQVGGSTLLNGDSSTAPLVTGEAGVESNGTTLWLNPASGSAAGDFFSKGGFGNLTLEGLGQIETHGGSYVFDSRGNPVVSPAVLIVAGTKIDPVVQNFVVNDVGAAADLTPITSQAAAQELASQRTAANLTFDAEGVNSGFTGEGPPTPGGGTYMNASGGGGLLVRGDLVLQAGASIVTDPQTNSARGVSLLAPRGTIAVLGSVVAPGGTITVTGGDTSLLSSNNLLFYDSSLMQPFATVDLAPGSLLSTAGVFERSVDAYGYTTGTVLPGGNVVISGNIVAEQGATVDVSGGSALVDETPANLGHTSNQLMALAPSTTRVESNAGSLTLDATQMLYSDATLLGNAGGSDAQGGSLTISSGPSAINPGVPQNPEDVVLVVTQQGLNGGFSIPTDAVSGTGVLGQTIPSAGEAVGAALNTGQGGVGVYSYFAASSNLFASTPVVGTASNNGGKAGGFSSLDLPGTVDFVGPVNIRTSRSITIATSSGDVNGGDTGGVIVASGSVVLSSAYVNLDSFATTDTADNLSNYPTPTAGGGSLTINASTLADVGNLSLLDIGTLSFNANPAVGGDIRGLGTLQVAGQINVNAAQIYPPTESTFTIIGQDVSITAPTGEPPPELPLSAGGTLNIQAPVIEQAGVLRAPFGTINLGTSTSQSVTLAAGSITSVSAVDTTTGKGITIPYGIVDASGQWFDPNGNNITLSGPPAKAINIAGEKVDLATGSTVDVAGGGDLYAYQFNSGTGGTQDILASSAAGVSSSSFAILPGYSLGYAPDGTFATSNSLETDNIPDAGYYNGNLAIGEQVRLQGADGLPAGIYTLLPARYATLPGAFLLSPDSSGAPGGSIQQPDGSTLVSGYVTSALAPTMSPVFNGYQLSSQALVLRHAPYIGNLANTYFPKAAQNGGVTTPPLPNDAGQLVLAAGQTLSLEGTLLSQPGAGGLGGQVDIASPEAIYIVGPNAGAEVPTSGALVLSSAQLTGFGAANLLIGGISTTTSAGVSVDVTTSDLVVDNGGSVAMVNGTSVAGLAAPDITLVSNGQLLVMAGSEIEQNGKLPGAAPTLTVNGNGALLRVSSDPNAQTVRAGVSEPDSSSLLSVGAGVQIGNAAGGAVGSLDLDSTAGLSIGTPGGTAPAISATSLTVDSGFINLELSAPATAPTSGLVINNTLLQSLLSSTQSLSLLSYSSIALYGSGTIGGIVTPTATGGSPYQEANLALHADDIYYADTQNSSGITINAQTVSIDNLSGGSALPTLTGLGTGNLTVNAQTISLGSNATRIDQFANVALNASKAILLKGLGTVSANSDAAPVASGLTVDGNLALTTPVITGAPTADRPVTTGTTAAIDESITASGAVTLQAPVSTGTATAMADPLGVSFSLTGSTVTQESGSIVLPSSSIELQATSSNVVVNGTLDASGVASTFYDLPKYTNGGQVTLSAASGNVTMGSQGVVNVSAASGIGTPDSGGANGGTLDVVAGGTFSAGTIKGAGGVVTQGEATIAQGQGGTLDLDTGSLAGPGGGGALLSTLEGPLTGFSSQTVRDRNDASVTVDGTITAANFNLAVDQGSIVVTGHVDASDTLPGGTGGTINLAAGGSVTVGSTGVLSAEAAQLDAGGHGGAISIEAGTYEASATPITTAAINLLGQIDLGVGAGTGGTLNLRAPQVSGGPYAAGSAYVPVPVNATGGGAPTDVAIAPIGSSVIRNAGKIVVEGAYVQDAQASSATIDSFEGSAEANASSFMAHAANIQTRIFGSASGNVGIQPGEEIDNSAGSLELQSSWDLSTLRYGASQQPGILTLRAAGNILLDFGASLNDGFDGSSGVGYLNPLLAVGSQSWSYKITTGADFHGASLASVSTPGQLAGNGLGGSLEVGFQNSSAPILLSQESTNSQAQFFQTIRTGTGNISINSGGDVLLLNNLATIYTAGTQVDPTLGGTFTPPNGTSNGTAIPATYSDGGGNVAINAQGNIAHMTYDPSGSFLVPDSSAELPTNWLNREGAVSGSTVVTPTTWWVDFTNFFEGIGALGGGNVALAAGGSVINVDAVVPTNARLVNGQLTELGGGNLSVRAGVNIDGGVYEVERGEGTLAATGNIQSNATRAAVTIGQPSTPLDWLPTTLFLGKGSFSLQAGGNLLFGPAANAFLLPQSYNNIASDTDVTSELSFFSTYAPTDAVAASSLAGTTTIRNSADSGEGSLYSWYTNVLDAPVTSPLSSPQISGSEPWLLLAESVTSNQINSQIGAAGNLPLGSPDNVFGGVAALLPPTLRVTAFSGDIDLIGSLTLSPAPLGTVDLLAQGSINAFEVNRITIAGVETASSGSGLVNLSDADPDSLPGISDPLSVARDLDNIQNYFTETGATEGITFQTKQDLHASYDGGTLHAGDTAPVYVYANTGNISGLTLFSAKQAQVVAGDDITDVGLYIQNNAASDVSLVDAGRDIIAYDASSPLRTLAGNNVIGYDAISDPLGAGAGAPNTGDIQISGPGTLEVLAGRDLTLGNDNGVTPNSSLAGDGLYVGLTSVGGQRNPNLPFAGATLVGAAGLGTSLPSLGLSSSSLDFTTFISKFLDPSSAYASTYVPDLATAMGLSGESDADVLTTFENLPAANRDTLALDLFYLVLRDAGRNHNVSGNPGFGNFDAASTAIAALFPSTNTYAGNIDTTSREIATTNGGDVDLLASGGGITVGINAPGGQAVDQGILTVDGGNVSIFTSGDVSVGTSRIFTLHGGNIIIYSSKGNIAAGASSKTVVSAPPTRVVVDPTSGSVETDLAGLSTGGGIGVLASVVGAPPGDVDLIAPTGIVDAGDAGIRASGNLNIAALKVLNADNISVGGKSTGVPSGASINIGALAAASSAAGSSVAAAENAAANNQPNPGDANSQGPPSIITVEVLGYGGSDD